MKAADMEWRKSSFSTASGDCVEIAWRKSSRSTAQNACVEMAFLAGAVAVRDSKNASGPTLAFPTVSWDAFRGDLRSREA
ncbi:DUF397 domain-containing protein [Actinophytocola sp.]|uniref:DUF397 domain-containing protein n=1 Tax=Actinophytocola sp. TaxID=1872138 RepID=UPI00389A0B9B